MDLTPLDVRKKKEDFRRALRGYDTVPVDSFLDLVADRLEALVLENARQGEQVRAMREQLSTYQKRERALNEALLAAHELREQARSQAERDAALQLREAGAEAAELKRDARRMLRDSEIRLEELANRRRQFVRSFRATLERFLGEIEAEEARLDAQGVGIVGVTASVRDERPLTGPEGEVAPDSEAEADSDFEEEVMPGPVGEADPDPAEEA